LQTADCTNGPEAEAFRQQRGKEYRFNDP